jgi:hypothetical protein
MFGLNDNTNGTAQPAELPSQLSGLDSAPPAIPAPGSPGTEPAPEPTPMPAPPVTTPPPVMPGPAPVNAPSSDPAAEGLGDATPLPTSVPPVASPPAPPTSTPASSTNGDDSLLQLKQQALQSLAPLVDHLDQDPEEKFKTTMMMIQASDNADLIPEAYEAANKIQDEKVRAQALLDVVNEINYFTHHNNGDTEQK